MKQILRGGIHVLALVGLIIGGSATVVADSHGGSSSPACDALADAGDQAASQAQTGVDRATDENDCGAFGPIPVPEE